MKQGRRVSHMGESKTEPKSMAIRPAGVAQMGSAQGNHAQDAPGRTLNPTEKMHQGRGFEAPPLASCEPHKAGSQGRYR